MKFILKTFMITVLSIFILNYCTSNHEKVEIIKPEKTEKTEKTEKISNSDIIKEESGEKYIEKPVVKEAVTVTKKLGSKTLEKTPIDKNTAVVLCQKVRLKFDKNLNESYTVNTEVIYWTKATRSNFVYSNTKYDISVEDIEDIKLKEYNLAVTAKDKIIKISKNK